MSQDEEEKSLSRACTGQAAKQEATRTHQHSPCKEQASTLGTTAHETQQPVLYEYSSVEVSSPCVGA